MIRICMTPSAFVNLTEATCDPSELIRAMAHYCGFKGCVLNRDQTVTVPTEIMSEEKDFIIDLSQLTASYDYDGEMVSVPIEFPRGSSAEIVARAIVRIIEQVSDDAFEASGEYNE